MSKASELERKRVLLSAEKRMLLEKRLRGNLPASGAGGTALHAGTELIPELAGCDPQDALQIDWASVGGAAYRLAQDVPPDLDLGQAAAIAEHAGRSAISYVCLALNEMGVFTRPGEGHTVDELIERLAILPSYRKLLCRWMTELCDAGLLSQEGGRLVSPLPLISGVQEGLGEGLRKKACEELPAIITGRKHTVELVFAEGSASRVEQAYESTAPSRYFNSIAAEIVKPLVEASPPDRQFRVLEVGAGVGGTTTCMLPILPPENALYAFTDLSQYFLDHARQKYEAYAFMRYGIFDINRDPRESGYKAGLFDVVLGANVVHCARYLGPTLRYLRSLLTPGGVIIMIEYTENRVAHIILPGLLEGFNHFEDERLEENKPLLSPDQWFKYLRSNGFEDCFAVPGSGDRLSILGQHVIAARAN